MDKMFKCKHCGSEMKSRAFSAGDEHSFETMYIGPSQEECDNCGKAYQHTPKADYHIKK